MLVEAALQQASLIGAQLQGASLDYALLQGAMLFHVQLQGASLQCAELHGAWLSNAQLQGASLLYAQLQGADLEGAWLQGAFRGGTQLQSASLNGVQLQGASLAGAELQGASFEKAFVWRAGAQEAVWGNTRVASPQVAPEKQCRDVDAPLGHPSGEVEDKVCEWTAATFEDLKRMISSAVPLGGRGGGEVSLRSRWRWDEIIERTKSLPEIEHEQTENRTEPRRQAMEKIEARLDPNKALEGEKEMAQVWAAHAQTAPAPEAYGKTVAEQWRKRGCAAEGAPDVLHALISVVDTPFRYQSDAAKSLAAAFLDEANCAGAHGLSEADKAALKKIAAPAAPEAPKP